MHCSSCCNGCRMASIYITGRFLKKRRKNAADEYASYGNKDEESCRGHFVNSDVNDETHVGICMLSILKNVLELIADNYENLCIIPHCSPSHLVSLMVRTVPPVNGNPRMLFFVSYTSNNHCCLFIPHDCDNRQIGFNSTRLARRRTLFSSNLHP